MKNVREHRAGFTLIEIMLVVVIIGILMTVVVVKFGGRQEEARVNAAKADIKNYSTALDLFELDNGFYPSSEQGLQAFVENTHASLLEKIRDRKKLDEELETEMRAAVTEFKQRFVSEAATAVAAD